MLRVTHPKGKTVITLGNFQMVINTKEINPADLAIHLETLTNNYTRSKEIHHDTLVKFNTLLFDYGEIKKILDAQKDSVKNGI